MAKRVLVVDDEQNIVDILRFNLEREGYEVITAEDGIQGLAMARSSDPDLILLDVMMPEMDGFQVCRELRREDKLTPIIMLTAREEEADRVMGLELGADDYVSKPFSVRELMARVRTNIRRQTAMNEPDTGRKEGMIRAGSITVDTVGLQIFKNGVPVEVTQREYALLLFLASSVGTVFSREILMQKVWNYDYWGDTRSVDVAVRRLREKLEDDPANPTLLCTRRGAGYYLSGN
ncbi:MAG: response regulator transcription factor [Oscillospiraceae bacterium]|nr:response regulator transcription factor [Oscillospiraceae bacterium]